MGQEFRKGTAGWHVAAPRRLDPQLDSSGLFWENVMLWTFSLCSKVKSMVSLETNSGPEILPEIDYRPKHKLYNFSKKTNRLPFPSLGDLPNPGIKPMSLVPPALASSFFTTVPPGNPVVSSLSGFFKFPAKIFCCCFVH